jgi:broad specificity phosphatase PhoE
MNLLIARHGNTFEADRPSHWVGAKNNMPLVESGKEQAKTLAKALLQSKLIPSAVYCGPLQRATEYAAIIIEELKLALSLVIDPRLNELDFGQWSGLTNEQVGAKFGHQAVDDWNNKCIWPSAGEWKSSPAQISSEINSFVKELNAKHGQQENVLLVTSNGRMRYFLNLVPVEFEKHLREQNFKVATGNVCILRLIGDKCAVEAWNVTPGQISHS